MEVHSARLGLPTSSVALAGIRQERAALRLDAALLRRYTGCPAVKQLLSYTQVRMRNSNSLGFRHLIASSLILASLRDSTSCHPKDS